MFAQNFWIEKYLGNSCSNEGRIVGYGLQTNLNIYDGVVIKYNLNRDNKEGIRKSLKGLTDVLLAKDLI